MKPVMWYTVKGEGSFCKKKQEANLVFVKNLLSPVAIISKVVVVVFVFFVRNKQVVVAVGKVITVAGCMCGARIELVLISVNVHIQLLPMSLLLTYMLALAASLSFFSETLSSPVLEV